MEPLRTSLILAILFGYSSLKGATFKATPERYQVFQRVSEKKDDTFTYGFRAFWGHERSNKALNRLSILSENQYDYPTPESGCGPTAMLNILIWYEKFGLIKALSRDANVHQYKLNLFNEIDRRLSTYAGQTRAELNGTSNFNTMIVMDELVSERSEGVLRLHSKSVEAPLTLQDFFDIQPNFRSGYLIVRAKDPRTNNLRSITHAVTFIRADRAGYITLGTWGEIYRGVLKKRGASQWFIPSDRNQQELKIVSLIQFIPFKPITPADHSPQ